MCELIRAIMINKDDIFMQYDKIRLGKIIQSHAQINIKGHKIENTSLTPTVFKKEAYAVKFPLPG